MCVLFSRQFAKHRKDLLAQSADLEEDKVDILKAAAEGIDCRYVLL